MKIDNQKNGPPNEKSKVRMNGVLYIRISRPGCGVSPGHNAIAVGGEDDRKEGKSISLS